MIRHVVMFRWNESVSEEQLVQMAAALDALPAAIPEIATYRHGADLGLSPTNFQYAITADFANVDDFVVYRDHPEHQRFIAEHITGSVAERTAVQFEPTT
jgi:hypothetical protein